MVLRYALVAHKVAKDYLGSWIEDPGMGKIEANIQYGDRMMASLVSIHAIREMKLSMDARFRQKSAATITLLFLAALIDTHINGPVKIINDVNYWMPGKSRPDNILVGQDAHKAIERAANGAKVIGIEESTFAIMSLSAELYSNMIHDSKEVLDRESKVIMRYIEILINARYFLTQTHVQFN